MPLTTAQRRQVNRQNAAKSTGPKTDEGKARSRQNALKHGLRAEALDLPNELPGTFEALADEWHDYYRPDSPGERALVDRAVHATIQLRRCARFQAEAVSQRVREAELRWDQEQADELDALDTLFWGDDPALAVRDLGRSAVGCALLLADWEALRDVLDAQGRWGTADRDRALRLCGQHPDRFDANPLAYLLRYYNLFALATPNPDMVAHVMDAKHVPPQLRGTLPATRPTPEESRDALRELVASELEALKARQARVAVVIEAERAGAADRALLLDGPEGALLLRYEKMHDGIFHRAYAALLKGRKEAERSGTGVKSEATPDAPNEPKPVARAESDAVAPNEPKPAGERDSTHSENKVSIKAEDRVAAVAEPVSRATKEVSDGTGRSPMAA